VREGDECEVKSARMVAMVMVMRGREGDDSEVKGAERIMAMVTRRTGRAMTVR